MDAQPGDGLLDVGVLTLRDDALTGPLLRGLGLPADAETGVLLDRCRLLRHLASAAWLLDRGYAAESARHAEAARAAVGARPAGQPVAARPAGQPGFGAAPFSTSWYWTPSQDSGVVQ